MGLFDEIGILEEGIEKIVTVEELRGVLKHMGLTLVVVIYSERCDCMEWDLGSKRLVKVLDLRLKVRVSNAVQSVESAEKVSVRIRETAWEEIEILFETLKEGIKSCMKGLQKGKQRT